MDPLGAARLAAHAPVERCEALGDVGARKIALGGSRHSLERAMRALRRLVRDIANSPDVLADVPGAFVALLDAASAVHGRLVTIRRWAYDAKWVSQTRVDAPVVSVGNVTWGGTGKTPMTEYIAREVADAGFAPAVLSRGYRGADEAMMLRRRLGDVPGARVLVGRDRGKLAEDALREDSSRKRPDDATAAFSPLAGFDREKRFAGDVDVDDVELRCVSERAAEVLSGAGRGRSRSDAGDDERRRPEGQKRENEPVAFLLDDGAQHVRLRRDVEVVMVHALRGWGNGRIVPRGPLREEPRALLSRADVVALHHFPRRLERETETETETDERNRARAFAEALERDVRALLDPDRNPLVIKTSIEPERIERLARYVGESPQHEWSPPLSRLRGARVFCPCGVGDAASVRASLERLTAPALDDPNNGYGLRVRRTGSVEVWDLGDHEPFWSCDATLAKIVNRFREMHRTSGDVGSAEARMVLTEKDVARVIASEPEKRFKALAALAQCDPLVLCAKLVVPDEGERRALNARLRRTLRR